MIIIIIALSCLSVTASADNSKISPELIKLIGENTEGGMVVTIRHHDPAYPTDGLSDEQAVQNDLAAQRELLDKISAITYYEVGRFSIGQVDVGLPYSAIEAVAAIDTVDCISVPVDEGCYLPLEAKCDSALLDLIVSADEDEPVLLDIRLAYNARVYIGFSDEDCVTHADYDRYLSESRRIKSEYHVRKNTEFYEIIADSADVELDYLSRYTPMIFIRTTAGEVEKIAALPQVWMISLDQEQTVNDEPTDVANGEERFSELFRTALARDHQLIADDNAKIYEDYEECYDGCCWTLIKAHVKQFETTEWVGYTRIGGRVLSWWAPGVFIYPFGYFVYDKNDDTLMPIENADTEKYDLEAVMAALGIGTIIGDADRDGEVTVMDATRVQRLIACLVDNLDVDNAADVDGDGSISILDATMIQRHVAELVGSW